MFMHMHLYAWPIRYTHICIYINIYIHIHVGNSWPTGYAADNVPIACAGSHGGMYK
jgi:hypothetical protein